MSKRNSVFQKRVATRSVKKGLGIPNMQAHRKTLWMEMHCLPSLSRIRYKLCYPEKHVIPNSPHKPRCYATSVRILRDNTFYISSFEWKYTDNSDQTFGIIMLIKDHTASEAVLHPIQCTSKLSFLKSLNPSLFEWPHALLQCQHKRRFQSFPDCGMA